MNNEDPTYETVLRDLYAGLAMAAIIVASKDTMAGGELAAISFDQADDMMHARATTLRQEAERAEAQAAEESDHASLG